MMEMDTKEMNPEEIKSENNNPIPLEISTYDMIREFIIIKHLLYNVNREVRKKKRIIQRNTFDINQINLNPYRDLNQSFEDEQATVQETIQQELIELSKLHDERKKTKEMTKPLVKKEILTSLEQSEDKEISDKEDNKEVKEKKPKEELQATQHDSDSETEKSRFTLRPRRRSTLKTFVESEDSGDDFMPSSSESAEEEDSDDEYQEGDSDNDTFLYSQSKKKKKSENRPMGSAEGEASDSSDSDKKMVPLPRSRPRAKIMDDLDSDEFKNPDYESGDSDEDEEDELRVDLALAHRGEGDTREYLVKWRDQSYIHLEWLLESKWMENERYGARLKLNRYLRNKPFEMAVDIITPYKSEFRDTGKEEKKPELPKKITKITKKPQDDEDLINVPKFNNEGLISSMLSKNEENTCVEIGLEEGSEDIEDEEGSHFQYEWEKFTIVDRIIASALVEKEDRSGNLEVLYLVKWLNLPYSESTWERVEDFNNDRAILEYRRFHIRPKQLPPPPLPQRLWSRLDRSPKYHNGNQLRKYQLEGVNWLIFCWSHARPSILADEMGLGKTVQVICFLEHLRSFQLLPGPYLIIVPLSTITHWKREFKDWTHMNVVIYQGKKDDREMIRNYEWHYLDGQGHRLSKKIKFNVLISTYETAIIDIDVFQKIYWQVLVVDEAHRMKNAQSKLLRNLQSIKTAHKILLTGTPLQNNIDELYTLLRFSDPHNFHNKQLFLNTYGDLRDADQVEELQKLLKPYLLRRMKEDVEKTIPPKEETVIEVEMTVLQKQFYRAILERNRDFLTRRCKKTAVVPNLINCVMQLRKTCNHPFLIQGIDSSITDHYNYIMHDLDEKFTEADSFEFQKQFVERARVNYLREKAKNNPDAQIKHSPLDRLIHSSGKLVLIDKLLAKLRKNGHKVLIFSQMTKVLDLLRMFCVLRGYPYERLDGRIQGNERQSAIDRFCDPGEDRFVFLLCTRAGGVGINLAAADTVIIFDSDWNPQNDIQAQARCHRIGQTNQVKVYRLITSNTYERYMFERASKKLGLDQVVLSNMGQLHQNVQVGGPQSAISASSPESSKTIAHGVPSDPLTAPYKMSKDDIHNLLRYGAYGFFRDVEADNKKSEAFCEQNIDQILERRTTQFVWQSATGSSSFSKATFSVSTQEDIDMNAENFWEMVLPEERTPAILLDMLTGKRKVQWDKTAKREFLRDVGDIVTKIANDFFEARAVHHPEKGTILQLLEIALSGRSSAHFDASERKIFEDLRSQLDFNRRRTHNNIDTTSNLDIYLDERLPGKRKKRKLKQSYKTGRGRGRPRLEEYSDNEMSVSSSSDEYNPSDDDFDQTGALITLSHPEMKKLYDAFCQVGLARVGPRASLWDTVRKRAKLAKVPNVVLLGYILDFLSACIIEIGNNSFKSDQKTNSRSRRSLRRTTSSRLRKTDDDDGNESSDSDSDSSFDESEDIEAAKKEFERIKQEKISLLKSVGEFLIKQANTLPKKNSANTKFFYDLPRWFSLYSRKRISGWFRKIKIMWQLREEFQLFQGKYIDFSFDPAISIRHLLRPWWSYELDRRYLIGVFLFGLDSHREIFADKTLALTPLLKGKKLEKALPAGTFIFEQHVKKLLGAFAHARLCMQRQEIRRLRDSHVWLRKDIKRFRRLLMSIGYIDWNEFRLKGELNKSPSALEAYFFRFVDKCWNVLENENPGTYKTMKKLFSRLDYFDKIKRDKQLRNPPQKDTEEVEEQAPTKLFLQCVEHPDALGSRQSSHSPHTNQNRFNDHQRTFLPIIHFSHTPAEITPDLEAYHVEHEKEIDEELKREQRESYLQANDLLELGTIDDTEDSHRSILLKNSFGIELGKEITPNILDTLVDDPDNESTSALETLLSSPTNDEPKPEEEKVNPDPPEEIILPDEQDKRAIIYGTKPYVNSETGPLEIPTIIIAHRVLSRIYLLLMIRDHVCPKKSFEERCKSVRTGKFQQPEWWIRGKHDQLLLELVRDNGIGFGYTNLAVSERMVQNYVMSPDCVFIDQEEDDEETVNSKRSYLLNFLQDKPPLITRLTEICNHIIRASHLDQIISDINNAESPSLHSKDSKSSKKRHPSNNNLTTPSTHKESKKNKSRTPPKKEKQLILLLSDKRKLTAVENTAPTKKRRKR